MFSVNQMIQGGNGALGSVGGTVPVVFKDAAGNIHQIGTMVIDNGQQEIEPDNVPAVVRVILVEA